MSDQQSPSRRWLLRAGASAALVACAPVELPASNSPDEPDPPVETDFDAEAIPVSETLFPIAVMAGAIRTDSVLLTTLVEDGEPVRLRVWEPGSEAGRVILNVDADVSPGDAGYLTATITELRPGTVYFYTFLRSEGDTFTSRSGVGRFKTAPAAGERPPLTVAISACNGSSHAPWPALIETARHDYDLFLHLGDMAYNDGAATLAAYRERWRGYLSGQGFREAYAQSGLLATWDDHEFDNDWNPETFPYAEIAKQAFFETLPVESTPTLAETPTQLWRSYRWGDTAEIFVLDCRSERRPSTRGTSAPIYISVAQMDWLKAALRDSTAHFKIVMNSVPITNMPGVWDFAAYDRWEGYAAQRVELLSFIDEEDIANVWFVSGDFHVCFAGRIQPGIPGRVGKMWEIAVTGGNSNILGETLNVTQFPYASASARACLIRFDPDEDSVMTTFIDPASGEATEGILSQS